MKKSGLLIILGFILCLAYSYKANAQMKLVVSLTGTVINELTREPVQADFDVFDETGKKIQKFKSNSKDGYYFITNLTPGKKYTLRNLLNLGSEKRYFKHKFEIDIPKASQYAEFSRDLVLKPLATGMAYKLKVTPFSINKTLLRLGSENVLKNWVDVLKETKKSDIEIACYPDNDNDAVMNQTVTTERCKALKDYFIKSGVETDRVTVTAHNNTDPKNPPPTQKRAKGKRYKGSIYIIIKES
ncbi:MAG: tpn50 [Ignavibacteria bacterium]|nr:tpn50 [Ignavibacteria bacterium]